MNAWVSIVVALPKVETPVTLLFHNGKIRIGELRWETPTHEETFTAFQYWDDPENDGQDWQWSDVVAWHPLPEITATSLALFTSLAHQSKMTDRKESKHGQEIQAATQHPAAQEGRAARPDAEGAAQEGQTDPVG